MKFCFQCGQQLVPEARFCVGCGAPASGGPEAGGVAPEARRQHEFAAAAAIPTSSGGAFAGIPLSDYVRDGVAALALILSLFMVWSYGSGDGWGASIAAARVDVILITLVSLLSLGLTYLWRAGVFGPSMGYRRIQDLKLLANLPYGLLVLVYVVLHLATTDRFEPGAVGTLGSAMAFGLAGALLAAQPRHGEIAPGNVDEQRNRRWIYVVLGVAGLAAAVALVQIIRYWVAASDSNAASAAGWGILTTLTALASPALLVFVALQVNKRSDRWRTLGVALGLGAGFLSMPLQNDLTMALDALSPGFSLLFWMAFGVAVSAPSVARLTEASAVAPTDRRSALQPFLAVAAGLGAVLAAGALIGLATTLAAGYSGGVVPQAMALFVGLLLTAGAVVTMRVAARDARSAYIVTSGYAGLLFVLGLVLVIVWEMNDGGYLAPIIMLLALVIPAALLAVLWLPAASREHFRSLAASNEPGVSGFSFEGVPTAPAGPVQQVQPTQPTRPTQPAQPAQPAQPVVQSSPDRVEPAKPVVLRPVARRPEAATPGHAEKAADRQEPAAEATDRQPAPSGASAGTQAPAVVDPAALAEAGNPATPLARLQDIVANHPEARAAVAANPSTYPALLAWLGQLGDPAVDQAIRQRG